MKMIFQRIVRPMDVDISDESRHHVLEFADDGPGQSATDDEFVVQIHSISPSGQHARCDQLMGRHVRITVETLDGGGGGKPHPDN